MKEFVPSSYAIKLRTAFCDRVKHNMSIDKDDLDRMTDVEKLTTEDYRYLEGVIFGLNH